MRRVLAGTGLGLGAALAAGPQAQAAVNTITVNSIADPGTGGCNATECTLREAITQANDGDTTDVDRIVFASALSGTITLNGTILPTIDEPLAIYGPGAASLSVSGNHASGILYVNTAAGADVSISGLTLRDATNPNPGGAIFSRNADLSIRDAVLTGNSTTVAGAEGGAVTTSLGDLELERSTISGNSAATDGGGAFTYRGNALVEDSTISGNSAHGALHYGGGLAFLGTDATIRRSTISGNTTEDRGGGVIVFYAAATIESSTISGNSAGTTGGGLWTYRDIGDPQPTLTNTIVAGNTAAGAGPDVFSQIDTLQASFSLIGNPGGEAINSTVPGSNVTGVDAKLGQLADNGGPTQTRALLPGSPAIDQGFAAGSDQRGVARPFDVAAVTNGAAPGANAADIGAFELNTQESCRGLTATLVSSGGPVTGTPGRDVIVGSAGRDVIHALGGNDVVCAGGGNDDVLGGGGRDDLSGEDGKDKLKGGGGNDKLLGGPGKDTLIGGKGKDKLSGGPGKDLQRQ